MPSVRGRVRIAQQLRRRTGLPLPVEVTYDDFTPDILENRLLRAAIDTLGALRMQQSKVGHGARRSIASARAPGPSVRGQDQSWDLPCAERKSRHARARDGVAQALKATELTSADPVVCDRATSCPPTAASRTSDR